ncbi:DNA-binding response regulator [Leptospira kmetyi]|uniref:DNA-binding response regulator n=2 Tax=Leptospira kmetyi TaxID=408139 RepID=A0AAD0XQY0_9LEPT|nr:LuxR C-terminal-related transcriptional regulator [Leptospira kmetyi]AYV56246.1 DNA-binding response regulator [Leptospira kmetyi]
MEIIPLFPLTAMFANLAALFALFKERDSFGNYFRALLIVLAGGNLCVFFLFHSSSMESAYFSFHVFRHFIFFVPPLLLALSRILSGRKAKSPMLFSFMAIAIGLILLIELDYSSEKSFLIREWKFYAWGWYPVLELPARILVGSFFGIGFVLSLYLLLKPKEIQGWIPFLVICWWLGFATNLISFFGFNLFPIGMGIDSIVSIFVSVYLSRDRADSLFHKIAELFASASVALGLGSISILFLETGKWGESIQLRTILLSSIGSGAAWFTLRMFRKKQSPNVLDSNSLILKGLTKQELRICELIAEGYTRKQIGFFLGIANGTFRNHLVNLYDKTIDREKDSGAKDKFQRLTVYLRNFEKS